MKISSSTAAAPEGSAAAAGGAGGVLCISCVPCGSVALASSFSLQPGRATNVKEPSSLLSLITPPWLSFSRSPAIRWRHSLCDALKFSSIRSFFHSVCELYSRPSSHLFLSSAIATSAGNDLSKVSLFQLWFKWFNPYTYN